LASNETVPLFSSKKGSIEAAIFAFDQGDQSPALYERFAALARSGFPEAYFYLGCIHEDGSNGQSRDAARALNCYEKCINGRGLVEAYLAAAKLHYFGFGTVRDLGKAFEYYSTVANSDASHVVAQLRMGRMLQTGEGVGRDRTQARYWLDRAIKQGSLYALISASALEREEGHLLRSLILRVRSIVLAVRLTTGNKNDPRLREF
jgi:TPR repeat protein